VVLERMLAGVSTRRYRRAQEPVGAQLETEARSVSESAVSRMFAQRTRDQLYKLMNRPLSDLRLAVIMFDGIDLHGRTNIVALGITTEGEKLALGLWDGSSENAAVAGALLSDLPPGGCSDVTLASTSMLLARSDNPDSAVVEFGRGRES
jgi:transposase-like protein